MYDGSLDKWVSSSIIKYGSFEQDVSEIIKRILVMSKHFLDGKTLFMDVGANLGIHGLYAAKMGFPVWAVEPQTSNLIRVHICLFSDITFNP